MSISPSPGIPGDVWEDSQYYSIANELMEHNRIHHRYIIYAGIGLAIAILFLTLLLRDPYSSAKGVGGAPEFIGQSQSFAVARLGHPSQIFEFTIAVAMNAGMPRYDLTNLNPALPLDTRVREVSWDKGQTFLTVWYRLLPAGEIGVEAIQWDKRLTSWAENMAAPPATTRPVQ